MCVIYDGSRKEVFFMVNNKSIMDEFFIQLWIDDVNGNKKMFFIIILLLFKLSLIKNNVLCIVNMMNMLLQDCEFVYWINVKVIFVKSEDVEVKNVLQIVVCICLKLFYCLVGLKGNSMDGWNKLQFISVGVNQIKVENLFVFNLMFNKFYVNGCDIEKMGMVLVKGLLNIELLVGIGKVSEVKYNIINDFGMVGDMLIQCVN